MKTQIKLDTTNAEHLIYKRPPLEIAILGGIRLDGLDRLRTTPAPPLLVLSPTSKYPYLIRRFPPLRE